MDNDKNSAIERILGTPFSGDLPNNALNVRRNLLATSVVSILLWWSDATLNTDSSFLGLKFDGIPADIITKVLLFLNVYFLIHFSWCAAEAFIEWRIRLTGQRVVPQTGGMSFGSSDSDNSTDPRQATLYSWWQASARHAKNLDQAAKELTLEIESISSEQNSNPSLNVSDISAQIKKLDAAAHKLNSNLEAALTVLNSKRLHASLKRFDDWFEYSRRVQSSRWIVLDLGLPMLLGIFSVALLAVDLC